MTEPPDDLRAEIRELRTELAEVRALLRASVARRRPRKAERARAEAPPEVRKSVRDKMVRSAAKRAR